MLTRIASFKCLSSFVTLLRIANVDECKDNCRSTIIPEPSSGCEILSARRVCAINNTDTELPCQKKSQDLWHILEHSLSVTEHRKNYDKDTK